MLIIPFYQPKRKTKRHRIAKVSWKTVPREDGDCDYDGDDDGDDDDDDDDDRDGDDVGFGDCDCADGASASGSGSASANASVSADLVFPVTTAATATLPPSLLHWESLGDRENLYGKW